MGCRGEREGGLFVLPSASTQQRERGEGRDAVSSCTAQEEEEEVVEAGLPLLCMQINRIPKHICHVTAPREAGPCTALI